MDRADSLVMMISRPAIEWYRRIVVFLLATLFSTTLIRILVRTYGPAFSLPVGLLSAVVGVVAAWMVLRRWRFTAPLRCAALVGLSSGLAGAGVFRLSIALLEYLFTLAAQMDR